MRCSRHGVSGDVGVDDHITKLQVETLTTGMRRNEDAGRLSVHRMQTGPWRKRPGSTYTPRCPRVVAAYHLVAAFGQEIAQHLLGRREFGKHQHFEIRIALLTPEAVGPIQKNFCLDVRALTDAALGRYQGQLHLGSFMFQKPRAES